jgi:hypothetical protein
MDREDVNNEVVETQVESGSKIMTSIGYPIFILASFWPSWGFAAKACGCENLYLCLQDGCIGIETVLADVLLPRERCLTLENWKQHLRELWKSREVSTVVVLLQVPLKTGQAVL